MCEQQRSVLLNTIFGLQDQDVEFKEMIPNIFLLKVADTDGTGPVCAANLEKGLCSIGRFSPDKIIMLFLTKLS